MNNHSTVKNTNTMFRTIMLLIACTIFASGNANALVAYTGTSSSQDNVRAKDTDSYRIVYVGGYMAGAFLSGDGDTDLDLYVYDDQGNLICSSDTNGDDEFCTFKVFRTSVFRVKVKNRGSISNNYSILFN